MFTIHLAAVGTHKADPLAKSQKVSRNEAHPGTRASRPHKAWHDDPDPTHSD